VTRAIDTTRVLAYFIDMRANSAGLSDNTYKPTRKRMGPTTVCGNAVVLWMVFCPLSFGQVSRDVTADSLQSQLSGLDSATATIKALSLFGASSSAEYDLVSHTVTTLISDHDSIAPASNEIQSISKSYLIRIKDYPYQAAGKAGTRDFEIVLDSATSQLIGIFSTLPTFEEKVSTGEYVKRPPVAPVGEAKLSLGNPWECIGPATVDPAASFLKALEAVPGNALKSDRIVANLYELKHPVFGHQTYWVIETYGGFTTIFSGGRYGSRQIKESETNYDRIIVDQAGKMVMSGN
jgi:hypothetical protein